MTGVWVLLFGIYYLIPFTDLASEGSVLRVLLGLRRVHRRRRLAAVSSHECRPSRFARRAGARGVILLFLVAFAARLPLAVPCRQHPLQRSTRPHGCPVPDRDRIFSTVGFGDITPDGSLAAFFVSTQMIYSDLVVLGAVVRLLTTAARRGLDRPTISTETPPAAPGETS